MTTDTLTLTAFLLARIDEDEAVAGDVAAERIRIGEVIDYPADGEDRSFWADYDGGSPSVSVGADRVLAECAAKRAILRQHDAETFDEEPLPWDAWHCGDCGNLMPCPTLRYLAAVYAGHDDYRAEWAL